MASVQQLIWYDNNVKLFSDASAAIISPLATSSFALALKKKSYDERYHFAITS
jgi:hypothetical protein